MSNDGVRVIAGLMAIIGLLAGWVNSYLILQMIGATTTMWVLWWGSLGFVILGSILMKVSE